MRSEIPNPDGALKSEMFASFKIATGEGEPRPAVPVEAVIREGDARQRLGRGGADAVSSAARSKIGLEQDGRVQIRDGLKAGELVVGRGAIFVDNEWRQ